MNESVENNLEKIRGQIAAAAERAGRAVDEVTLIAVSKGHPPEAMAELVDAGQTLFGESRVQEARAKVPRLPSRARLHLIGHLQSNKVRQALPMFERLHGIDSLEIARDVNRIAGELGLFPKILLEVNVAGEGTKFGFTPERLEREMEELLALDRLEVDGLMAIPPFAPDPEAVREYFVRLRELRDQLETTFSLRLPELSMGMSHDFPVAIEEGATMVRVGTALFGERKAKSWKPGE